MTEPTIQNFVRFAARVKDLDAKERRLLSTYGSGLENYFKAADTFNKLPAACQNALNRPAGKGMLKRLAGLTPAELRRLENFAEELTALIDNSETQLHEGLTFMWYQIDDLLGGSR